MVRTTKRRTSLRLAALVASTYFSLVAPSPAAQHRAYDLGRTDYFSVAGSGVGCSVTRHDVVCALRDPRTHRVLLRSRLAVIGDDRIEVGLARSEVQLLGHHLLFRDAQPPAITLQFATSLRAHGDVRIRSGDTLSIAGTHIWCTDLRASLTCADVDVPLRTGRPGAYAFAISPTAIAVEQAGSANEFEPLIVWPLIGGH
jgi:hypothetical protein